MQSNSKTEDWEFLETLVLNPSDYTLRLVYADWLEDHGDARAEFVRLDTSLPPLSPHSRARGVQADPRLGFTGCLHPFWLALMLTLARPALPITLDCAVHPDTDDPLPLPLAESTVLRGCIITFQSQFTKYPILSDGLTKDLDFLWTLVQHGEVAASSQAWSHLYPFLCTVPTIRRPVTGADVLASLQIRDWQGNPTDNLDVDFIPWPGPRCNFRSGLIHNDPYNQHLLHTVKPLWHATDVLGRLTQYVHEGRVWFVDRDLEPFPVDYEPELVPSRVTIDFAVGLSPHGDRLVGVISSMVGS